MFDHITIPVCNLIKSKTFYEKVLASLGHKIAFGEETVFWAFDIGDGALFEIAQYIDKNNLTVCHIAFRANSQTQVQQFHKTAIAAGGKCNGSPGLRPQYTPTYYAAFVLDPDGYNIEAVFDSNNTNI